MTFSAKSVSALAFALALAACGGGAEEAENPADAGASDPAAVDVPAAAPEPGETPVAEETPAATPTDSASPAPAATEAPAPAAPAAAATPVAAAGPPQAFAQCAACHKVDPGQHGIGPSLAGVFGAKAGEASGFNYSKPMLESDLTWNQANLDRYLDNPRGMVPGTTMAFGGVKDDAKRQAIIDYLKGL